MYISKQAIRERVWNEMKRRGVALFPGADGRIPNFKGARLRDIKCFVKITDPRGDRRGAAEDANTALTLPLAPEQRRRMQEMLRRLNNDY